MGNTQQLLSSSVDDMHYETGNFRPSPQPISRDVAQQCCEGKWINQQVKKELQKEVAELERSLEEDKDWNPHSNEQTWNLVNPSLYSFINCYSTRSLWYYITPLVLSGTDQRNLPISHWIGLHNVLSQKYSFRFQWLPSEFQVDENGKVTIQSYINNLHPYRFRNLYKSIANIFEQFVPQFENCLSKTQGTTISLRGKTLQVIVKISENVLTPQKPFYDSGMMHTVLFLTFFLFCKLIVFVECRKEWIMSILLPLESTILNSKILVHLL